MPLSLKSPPRDYGEALAPGARSPAPYAAGGAASRGRKHAEPECPTRSPFQRDRDRVLHSTAFRRLTYKTQVFVYHEGDHYRTRLTHSLEVAQIARTIARQLRLDEDLAEVLALAHDLGHSPFGHAGERALDKAMGAYGGFDHNAQSLRVVSRLERKYPAFDGLNLSWETLEGLIKHNGPIPGEAEGPVRKVARRISEGWIGFEPARFASGEAQVAALADDIAYLTHDIDDGLRAGLLSFPGLEQAPFVGPVAGKARGLGPLDGRLVYSVTRRMITDMIADCVAESRRRLAALAPSQPDDIRAAARPVIGFSAAMAAAMEALRAYLFQNVYRHERVKRVMDGAEAIVANLFSRYHDDQGAMPEAWARSAASLEPRRRARLIADFVAGQTDRYAISEHRRLFDATPELR